MHSEQAGYKNPVQFVKILINGVIMNVTCRLTSTARYQILKLLRALYEACANMPALEILAHRGSIRIEAKDICGAPDMRYVSTGHVERQNLTGRIAMRRFTVIENHKYAVALHYFHNNFIRKHQTMKTTPRQWLAIPIIKGPQSTL
jgi:hypothetical protein